MAGLPRLSNRGHRVVQTSPEPRVHPCLQVQDERISKQLDPTACLRRQKTHRLDEVIHSVRVRVLFEHRDSMSALPLDRLRPSSVLAEAQQIRDASLATWNEQQIRRV